MSLLELLLLSLGLAMDATAVATTRGAAARPFRASDAARMAVLFGLFQGLMPALGYAAGSQASQWLARFDHWIAFGLLAFLGGKMIWEGRKEGEESGDAVPRENLPSPRLPLATLVALALATSIDAFAVGVTLPLFHVRLVVAATLIAAVTAAMSLAGAYAGKTFGAQLGSKLDVVGAVVLVAIGLKILVQHLADGT